MNMEYSNMIEHSDLSSIDKKKLRDFIEVLNKHDPDNFPNYTKEELKHIFQIAKISSKLQFEMWKMLPDDVVNDSENIEIFEEVLDNRFGEYIKEIINLAEHENDEKKAEHYRMYYYFHKKELLAISKDVSPIYKVDMEREFLDLYARQYDRALDVQANRIRDVTYDGKNIPVILLEF